MLLQKFDSCQLWKLLLTQQTKKRQKALAKQSQIEAKRSERGAHGKTMGDVRGLIWQSCSKPFVSFLPVGLIIFTLLCFQLQAKDSITGWDITYREMCKKAASDPFYFQNFRALSDYAHALEVGGVKEYADYILKHGSPHVLSKMERFENLDELGSPPRSYIFPLGNFTGTTLRYILFADLIGKLFELPANPKIVEIGAGFGGQCYILSELYPFSKYYIFDLPEPEALIEKMMNALEVQNVICLPIDQRLPEEKIDLLISNYAFSECSREMQLDYFERVIKKADRGFMIYTQLSRRVYGMDTLTTEEFMQLLRENGMNPRIYDEPIKSDVDNHMIIWDRIF